MTFALSPRSTTAGKPPLPSASDTLDFVLPPEREASEPPEARGLARDAVRLLVSQGGASGTVTHARFHDLGRFLNSGDLLVVNTSGTRSAALPATRVADGTRLVLHLSTRLPVAGLWSVEVRRPAGNATEPFLAGTPGETLGLPGGATVTLHAPYRRAAAASDVAGNGGTRLWVATLELPQEQTVLDGYLAQHGAPIRYGYVHQAWPASYYQTVFAMEPGSAEMPSAGRAFTPELVTRLVAQGVSFAPLVLHTGVASLEEHEPPYEEFYRVPVETARAVNAARAAGRRIVAVGTTVVRALETVTDREGVAHPGEGWTPLVITAERGLRAVSALLTGLHEPRATHLAMLQALAGRKHVGAAYAAALRAGYLWHEFGDLHLLLPERPLRLRSRGSIQKAHTRRKCAGR